jgi:hypothetical protein
VASLKPDQLKLAREAVDLTQQQAAEPRHSIDSELSTVISIAGRV